MGSRGEGPTQTRSTPNRRDATRHDRNKYVLGNQLLYVELSI